MLTEKLNSIFSFIKSHKVAAIVILSAIILVVVAALLWQPYGKPDSRLFDRPDYIEAFTLVNNTISSSASITINLPEGIDKEGINEKITFTPNIKGEWLSVEEKNKIVFKPNKPLKEERYYSVTLESDQGTIGKDFLIVQDPEVIAIFPNSGTETHENSEITIMFNRPMVPLSTLDIMNEDELPIEVIPETSGRYKWIGTRTLQFIPEETLIASANYTVQVKDGFISMDGLPIASFEHKFITRPLRYENILNGKLIYNQPFRVKFNQPVDLEKVIDKITIENTVTHRNVNFIAEYATNRVYNYDKEKYEEIIDESQIVIYNKKDRFGRSRLWDFETGYYLNIQKAYPKHGDIIIDRDKGIYREVTGIISQISATSERTNFSRPDFFDPQGELIVDFYEDIDIKKSRITADHLKDIRYGERCKTNENDPPNSRGVCEIEESKSQLILTFESDKLEIGETVPIKFKKIKNFEKLQINKNTITREMNVIPEFKVIKTIPDTNNSTASLTKFTLCTNSPISTPAKEDIDEYINMSDVYEFKSWGKARLVPKEPRGLTWKCNPLEFQTTINYGLMPEHDYVAKIKLVDHFDREIKFNRSFRTEKMPSRNLNFFHFQDKYNVTQADKTTLTYAAVNMEFVDFNLCKLEAKDLLQHLEKNISYLLSPDSVNDCTTIINKRIELPKRFWIKNHFQVNLADYIDDDFGHYILTFSHPDYRRRSNNKNQQIYERTFVSLTNLNIVEKRNELHNNSLSNQNIDKLENLYWVSHTKTLEPVANARLELYAAKDRKSDSNLFLSDSLTTNEDGIALAPVVDEMRGVVVKSGEDSAIVARRVTKLKSASTASDVTRMYLYTDRPIYRPGHEVFIKAIYRFGFDGEYDFEPGDIIPVKVYDSKNQEILSKDLDVGSFGTINTSFIIDSKAPLGRYRIEAKGITAHFDVEEFVPSPFKVEVSSDQEEYISGDTLMLEVDADYFFGVPLEGGEVEYGITTQRYHFDRFSDGFFSFGNSWYSCYYNCRFNDEFLLRSKVPLEADGTATIIQKLNFSELFEDETDFYSKIFVFYVTVKNSSGQAVSTQKSIIVHNGEYYLGVKTNRSYASKNAPLELRVKSVDTQGNSLKVKKVKLEVSKVKWITHKRREVDGGYYYRSEKQYEKIREEFISTDNKGDWAGSLQLKDSGRYEITVTGFDARGNQIKDTYNLYIYGSGRSHVRPTNDTSLEVTTDNSNVSVGEKGQILIQSPFEKAKALITLERGKIFSYEVVDVNQSLYQYEFEFYKEQVPNAVASVVLVSPEPDVKYGQVNFSVNTAERDLNIDISSDKDYYLPGEDANLSIKVTDHSGQPVETELSIATVDLSVLALKGNPKKSPVNYFYSNFPHTISTISNLKHILHEVDVPSGTKGGGGTEPEDLAKRKRGIFKETAYWQAVLVTDQDGTAQASFTLPDNLTSWQVESVGVTRDTKVGVGYHEFTSRKELMLTPLQPRFVVPGDEFWLGAKVFNQTGEVQKLNISFDSPTLEITNEEFSKTVNLKSEETRTVYFELKSPNDIYFGEHTYTLSAANEAYEDTVEKKIKITRNDTYETTATAGMSSDARLNEYVFVPNEIIKDKGELTINSSATLAVFLSDALNSLLAFPYGCSEQIASKLDALAILKRGLNLDNIGDAFELEEIDFEGQSYDIDQLVEIGLGRIYQNQKSNGYFSYYPSTSYSPYVTLHIANTLLDLQEAGYKIDRNRLKRAADALNQSTRYDIFRYDENFVVLAAYTISRINGDRSVDTAFIKKINQLLDDEQKLNEHLSNLALVNLAMLTNDYPRSYGKRTADKVYAVLENQIDIDARGAFLPVSSNVTWRYYETPIKNTAFLLKALVARDQEHELMDRLLRWLLRSRSKDGAWGSTNNTLSVIDGMTEYLIWRQENKSEFNLEISLNGDALQSFEYTPQTILTQNSVVTPIENLKIEELNTVTFNKENQNKLDNNFYYDLSLKYFLPVDQIPPRDEGFTIQRNFYQLDDEDRLYPVTEAKQGEVLRGEIKILSPRARNFVAVEDFIPAGVELVNFNLDTSDKSLQAEQQMENRSHYRYWYRPSGARILRPDITEMRDDRLFLYKERMPVGEYKYEYFVRVLVPGTFHHLPAVVSEWYFPENFARTRGDYFEVKPE